MYPKVSHYGMVELAKRLMKQGLEDDGLVWDFTSLGTLSKNKITARVLAKGPGIWVGDAFIKAVEILSQEMGQPLVIQSSVADGDTLKAGQRLLTLTGQSTALLAFERPFLNLVSYLGGIAFQTSLLVSASEKGFKKNVGRSPAGLKPPRVTSTRKTLPGYRDLAVYAVTCGGGYPHRVSLSGGVLIKENHIAAAGSISKAVEGTRNVAPHGLKVECEVRNLKELDEAIDSGVDAVLLDNFSAADAKKAVQKINSAKSKMIVEVSGGIQIENIADYSIPGVDIISSGSLTHSVKAIDLSLIVE